MMNLSLRTNHLKMITSLRGQKTYNYLTIMNLHIDNDTCHEIIFTQGGVSHSLDKLYYNEHLVWQKLPPHDYSQDYFTIESREDNNSITLVANGTPLSIRLYYSTDDGTTWSSYSEASSKQWVLNTGDKILFKANEYRYYKTSNDYWSFTGTKTHKVYGNIMSLLYGDNFIGQTSFPPDSTYLSIYNFGSLFKNDAYLLDASNLILYATTLTDCCYHSMFANCTSLAKAPALPATTLTEGCYGVMFGGCSSLTKAPALPATTLAKLCYNSMFMNCTSLTEAPELQATTLAEKCYSLMFVNCSSLITAPVLPATNLVIECYREMFWACSSLTEAPELKATTLAEKCYYHMFRNCTSLKKIVCLATNISATQCVTGWVDGVYATGDFYKAASMSSWTTGTDGIPSGWTVNNYS